MSAAPGAVSLPRSIEFTVPGEPLAWARAGGGKTRSHFTPKDQRQFMRDVRTYCALSMRGAPPLVGPVELSICCVFPWPASWSARRRAQPGAKWKISKPDGDNLLKIVKDSLGKKRATRSASALPALAYDDDARVARWLGWKQYGDAPRLVVALRELGDDE